MTDNDLADEQLEQVCGPEGSQLTESEIKQIKKEAAEAHERHEEKQRRSEEYWREKRARERNFERMVLG